MSRKKQDVFTLSSGVTVRLHSRVIEAEERPSQAFTRLGIAPANRTTFDMLTKEHGGEMQFGRAVIRLYFVDNGIVMSAYCLEKDRWIVRQDDGKQARAAKHSNAILLGVG